MTTTASPAVPGGVRVSHADKTFRTPNGEELAVLDDINLTVEPGEFVSIVGPSGCGKTTLLRILQGLDRPTGGEVALAGLTPGQAKTAFVFQRASLLPWHTVRRNVAFGTELAWFKKRQEGTRGATRAAARSRVDQLLELTNLREFADYYPAQISGGMQQRANLARALAIEPGVLLMDEPFSALDAQTKERLQRELQHVVSRLGTTTVFITHDIREAAFQSDRVVVMSSRPGRIKRTFTIDRERPRDAEFQQSDELSALAREIWQELHLTSGECGDRA
jgi:ABC-type nitrate/sulfonate/bicarbonate transport system ATPase subunit